MTIPRVILASQSPRRRELLTLVGIEHSVQPADIDESYLPGETPRGHCERLAREKTQVIAASAADALVIGSDTIVVVDGDVLGKPRDEAQAAELYDVRAGLFAAAIRILATKITPDQLWALEELLTLMDAAVAKQSLDDYDPLNLKFHESLMRFAGNSRLRSMYAELIKELHLFRERALLHGGGLAVSNSEHRKIVEALRAGDATAAMEEAFNHVLSGKARMAMPETSLPTK